jgi:hypothetical protein
LPLLFPKTQKLEAGKIDSSLLTPKIKGVGVVWSKIGARKSLPILKAFSVTTDLNFQLIYDTFDFFI